MALEGGSREDVQHDVTPYNIRGLMGMTRALIESAIDGRDPLPGVDPVALTEEVLRRIGSKDPEILRMVRNRLGIIQRTSRVISFDWAQRLKRIKDALRQADSSPEKQD